MAEKRKMFADLICEKRRRKGVTRDEAERLIMNRNYFGAMMVETGEADALVSGVTSKYPEVIRPALQLIGPAEGTGKIAGMYIVLTRKGPVFFSDTTVNTESDHKTLAETALLTAAEVRKFGIEPVIAMLSYSNFGSVPFSESAREPEEVRKAVKFLHEKHPDLIIDGEIQANFAVNKDLRMSKFPFSKLGDREVNTLIFPNLSAGNAAFKLMQELGGAEVIGPVLLRIRKPVHVVPLECSVREIVHMSTIAAVDAQRII